MDSCPVSAVVITLNEEHNIDACLSSLAFADEIVVLDSGSSDRTVELARKHTDRVFVEPFQGHVEPRRDYASSLASHEWVLVVDADERATPELAQEIQQRLPTATCSAFKLGIREFMFGGWIDSGGWEGHNYIRLLRKSRGGWSGVIHEPPRVEGEIETLKHGLVHHSHVSVRNFLQKMNRYTDIEAEQRFRSGRKARLWTIAPRFAWTLAGRFGYRRGFRDGARGFVIALLMAVYHAMEEVKTWERFAEESRPVRR